MEQVYVKIIHFSRIVAKRIANLNALKFQYISLNYLYNPVHIFCFL